MKRIKEFPFDRARRVTAAEVRAARKGIEEKLGVRRPSRGRPPKPSTDKYLPLCIRLHPMVLAWAKQRAKELGIGYQTVINQTLLRLATAQRM